MRIFCPGVELSISQDCQSCFVVFVLWWTQLRFLPLIRAEIGAMGGRQDELFGVEFWWKSLLLEWSCECLVVIFAPGVEL